MQPWQQQQVVQQAVRQQQQANQHAMQQAVLRHQQVVRQRAARQPTATVAGCARTLVGIVVMVALVSVFFVLLLTHPF